MIRVKLVWGQIGLKDSGEAAAAVLRLKIQSPERDHLLAERDLHAIDVGKERRWDQQFVFVENVEIVEGRMEWFRPQP